MTTFFVDFYCLGLQRTADIIKESNTRELKYSIHFTEELSDLIELEWVEITYEYPLTYLDGIIIAPLAQVNYSKPYYEEKEIVDSLIEAIAEQEYRA